MDRNQARSITCASDVRANRLLSPCVVSDAWNPEGSSPEPKRVQLMALWDTGATQSAITQKVVDSCGLKHDGLFQAIHHAQGKATNVPKYYVNFVLPNNVGIISIPVSLGNFIGADILIGMDVIAMGDFAVTNRDGKTKFSFRIPSISDIDFVKEDNDRIREENERNRRREFLQSKGENVPSRPKPKKQRRRRKRK